MDRSHKFQWPAVFSGLQGSTWPNFPREISAGITLAALIIPLNIGYAQVAGRTQQIPYPNASSPRPVEEEVPLHAAQARRVVYGLVLNYNSKVIV